MIKKIFLFLSLMLLMFACQHSETEKTIITVNLPSLEGETIKLFRLDRTEEKLVKDIKIKNNKAIEIKLNIKSPAFYSLRNDKQKVFFILHPGDNVRISSSEKNFSDSYLITGSIDSDILQRFIDYIHREDMQRDSLIRLREAAMGREDFITIKGQIDSTFLALLNLRKEYVRKQIKQNPASLANLILINKPFGMQRAMDEIDNFSSYHIMDTALTRKFPNNYWVKDFHDKVEKIRFRIFDEFTEDRRLEPNKKAPNMVLYDSSGQRHSVKRYGFEKKPVLLFFWGSWEEESFAYNEKLKKNYPELFKKNNISIMGISLDNSEKVWKMTLAKEQLPWLNVSDLRGMNSEVLKAYNLTRKRLPMFYFINERRRIVFRTQNIDSCLIKVQNWQNERVKNTK